ncbi:MAG: hypothetical protein QOD98_13 [Nocardioidaceae bacterium]|nr:hypothetical protein [Nocardioidaceae bacterium]
MWRALQGQVAQVGQCEGGAALVEMPTSEAATQDRRHLEIDELRCCQALTTKPSAGPVSVDGVIRQGDRQHARVNDEHVQT